jgi:hypothetical protein
MLNTRILKDFLDKYNFKTDLINTETKWHLTRELKTGQIESYPVIICKSQEKSNSINVVIEIEWTQNEDSEFAQLEKIFRMNKAMIGQGAVLKSIALSDNIEKQISSLIDAIKTHKLNASTKKGYS